MMCLLAVVYLPPLIGSGPIWTHFAELVHPCKSVWWTNMIWISNIYPAAYEDKCLPWTFFMPLYVQLTLTLPLVVAFHKMFKNKLVGSILMCLASCGVLFASYAWIYSKNVGGSMVKNDEYLNDVYMNPLVHWYTFYMGIFAALMYNSYRKTRESDQVEERSSEFLTIIDYICNNSFVRYPLYLVGLGGMFGCIFWQKLIIQKQVST